jgi:hypothetical protein
MCLFCFIGRAEIISGSDGILPDTCEPGENIIEKAPKEIIEQKKETGTHGRSVPRNKVCSLPTMLHTFPG